MGYEILVTLFLLVLAPLVVLGFVAFWALVNRERALIEGTWRSFAVTRGREYVAARGEWPNRSSPSVRWENGDVRLELSVAGAEANARTRLVAWPRGKLLGSFVVRPGSCEGDPAFDDAAFDCAFAVSSRPVGLAPRVLSRGARRALLGFWQRDAIALTYRRGKLTLEWPGRESNDARLDEAERVITALAASVDEAFHTAATTPVPAAGLAGGQSAE